MLQKLSIKKDSSVSIRDQLVEQIGLQIASGLLRAEEKLPSIRALAKRLDIHYNTVSSAYNHLAEVGLVDVRQGSGVRVASTFSRREMELKGGSIDLLLRDFLALAAEHGYSRADLQSCISRVVSRQSVEQILVIDRNEDFHQLLLAELAPQLHLPVKAITLTALKEQEGILANSLVVTSLYHVFSLQSLPVDPTRLVVCNVEPGRAEMELIATMPSGSLVLLVSVSPTLLKMATNILVALRGEEVPVRTVILDDQRELKYMLKYAKVIICDKPSEQAIHELGGKPTRVFHLYSQSTIDLIKDRLQKWG